MSPDQSGPKRPPRPAAPRGAQRGRGDIADQQPTSPPPGERAASESSAATATATISAPVATDAAVAPGRSTSNAPASAGGTPAIPTAPAAPPASTTNGRRRRGRRVTRVVRRIDLWSVLKLSLIVYSCLYVAVLATLAVLWSIAYSSGTIDNLQSFLEDVGLENFTFYGDQMFRACAAIGGVAVLAGTIVTVLATGLVNVISEMSGGIRLVVIEEDVDRP